MLVNVIAQVASLSPSWLVCTLQAPLPRSLWRCFFAFNKRVSSWSTILCWNRLCRWRRIHLEAVVQVCCSCFQNDQWSVKLLHHQTSLCKTQRTKKNFVNQSFFHHPLQLHAPVRAGHMKSHMPLGTAKRNVAVESRHQSHPRASRFEREHLWRPYAVTEWHKAVNLEEQVCWHIQLKRRCALTCVDAT